MNRDSQRLRLALIVLLLISVTLITLDNRSARGGVFGGLRHATTSVVGPIQRGFSSVLSPVGSFFSDIAHSGRDRHRVTTLQAKVDNLEAQIRGNGDIARDRTELQGLVALAGPRQYTLIPARVVAIGDLSGFDYSATLNVGSHDGIKLNMTVINGAGLVGRVVSVAPFSSTVALVIDPNVRVGSRLERNTEIGITYGHGQADLTFTPQDPSVRPRKGDIIETYGSVTYAPGVPIGQVVSVSSTPGKTTTTAQVKRFVDYTALNVVGVVVATARTQTALPTTPPQPTVTVTVTATPSGAATGATSGTGAVGSPRTTGTAGKQATQSTQGTASASTTPTAGARAGPTPTGTAGG